MPADSLVLVMICSARLMYIVRGLAQVDWVAIPGVSPYLLGRGPRPDHSDLSYYKLNGQCHKMFDPFFEQIFATFTCLCS